MRDCNWFFNWKVYVCYQYSEITVSLELSNAFYIYIKNKLFLTVNTGETHYINQCKCFDYNVQDSVNTSFPNNKKRTESHNICIHITINRG